MWTSTLVLIHILVVHSHPLMETLTPYIPRDLEGLLDGDALLPAQNTVTTIETSFDAGTTSRILGGIVTSETKSSKTTSTIVIGTTHSIIGTLPIATMYMESRTTSPSSTSASASASPSPSPSPATPSFSVGDTGEAARMPPGEAAEWRVIGLVVICIGFVATAILSVVFFDSWWGFLRDLTCGKRRREGVEDMVPDWEKRSWEFKLASEDGHRYPTLSSLECIAKERAEGDLDKSAVYPMDSQTRSYPELMSPRLPYLSDCDSHPLEPFFRRPSTRQMTSPQASVPTPHDR